MRKYLILIFLVAFLVMLRYCAITHKFGPFSGKIVDAQTGEPIEGAVVLIGFQTKGSSVGGWVWHFADAVEILTDAKGEFQIPPKRVTLFRPMDFWDKDCRVSIFKPGYGAFPGHRKTFSAPKLARFGNIPENEHITYYLPKLLTLEEKHENLFNIEEPAGITNDKMPNMLGLQSKERVNVGLKP